MVSIRVLKKVLHLAEFGPVLLFRLLRNVHFNYGAEVGYLLVQCPEQIGYAANAG